MTKPNLTIRLSNAFRRLAEGVDIVPRDSIVINPAEAISEGIWQLNSIGVLSKEDAKRLIEEYCFKGLSMDEIINDQNYQSRFIELIDVLNEIEL